MTAANLAGASGSGTAKSPRPKTAVTYVAAVIGVSVAANLAALVGQTPPRLEVVLAWSLFAAFSQVLIFPTVTRSGEVTLGTCVHLAMMAALAPAEFLPALWLSRLGVHLVQWNRPWYRALFNASQVSLSVLLASLACHALGGTTRIDFDLPGIARVAPGFLAGAAVYYVVNMAAVSAVVALHRGDSMWRTWRANYGYAAEIVSTVGLVLLAPVMVVCYLSLGAWGLVLFAVPMLFVRDASRRYVELRRTQQALIGAERLAAKGELAGQVGHEIHNYLAVLEGQLDVLRLGHLTSESREHRLEAAREQVARIRLLTRGLLEYNQRASSPAPTDLAELFRRTSEWVSHQRTLDGVAIHARLDPSLGEVTVDPGQMQQVLMNLLLNAAQAMNEEGSPQREIALWLERNDLAGVVEIGVADSGPGIPEHLRSKLFTPGYTTRPDGHGYGLAAVQAIVEAHRGRIVVSDSAGGGAQFVITLPFEALGVDAAVGPASRDEALAA